MKVTLLILVLVTLAACGTIAHGTSQNIGCATSPAGARVITVDGAECTTPCALTLKRKQDAVLTIEKAGYETVTLQVRSVVSLATAGNILMPVGIVFWGIDHISGGQNRLVPEHLDIALRPLTPQSEPSLETASEDSALKAEE